MDDRRIRKESIEDAEVRHRADEAAQEHKAPTQEEYEHDWRLVKETEGLDDEEVVKEYSKIFSEDSSHSHNKGKK